MAKATSGAATPLPKKNDADLKKRVKALAEFINLSQQPRVLKALMSALYEKSASKLGLSVSTDLSPRTDGSTVYVSMLPDLLGEEYTDLWPVLFRPITAHEVQHCNSSCFSDMQEIRKWYGNEMEKNGFDRRIGESIAGDFLNAVEDGRIEKISADRHPGLVMPYRLLNDCIRNGCAITKAADNPEDEFQDLFGQVLSYAKTGLYAPGIAAYEGSRLETNFLMVRPAIDAGVNARTSADCRSVVQGMLSDLMPYLAELLKESEKLQKQLKDQKNTNEYTGDNETETNSGGSGESGSKDGKGNEGVRANSPNGFGHFSMGGGNDDGEGGDAEGTNYGFGGVNDGNDKGYTPEQLADMEDAARHEIASAQKQAKMEAMPPEMDGLSDSEVQKLLDECYGKATSSFREEWMKYEPKTLPADLSQEAMALRRKLVKFLTNKKAPQTGRKSGVLDKKLLWKTGVGCQDVFYRPGRKDTDSCVFYLLIDNSGSMSETVGKVSKSFAARRAAAVIEEALKGLVPVKVSLFESYGNTRHISLKTFDSKQKVNACYSSLQVIRPGGYNADSVHIRVAAQELINRPERKKFLFVLSDGMPSAFGNRERGEREVRKAVDDARRKGVVVIPIMFGSEGFRQSYRKNFAEMYAKDILSCSPNEISSKLPDLFRRFIMR